MTQFTRRAFLQTSALAGAAWTARSWAAVPGANGAIRVAVVGLNGKGKDHVSAFRNIPGVRVVALCDVDRGVLDESVQAARALGEQPQAFEDYRELLAQKDIDAVSIVTPNHQHTLQAVWALQAGKDVFVEKPVSHDLWEGQQLVRATNKYGRIVQAGMQNRSSPPIAQAIAWQRAGHIGKIKVARGLCFKRRESIGKTSGPQPVPNGVNYDLWLGPLPKGPLRRTRLHYDWHWQWATGNGDIGNQGNHQIDVARRFLGQAALPPRVTSAGGRLGYSDDGETPNTLIVTYDYPGAPLVFELRGLPTKPDAAGASKPAAPPPVANTPGASWSPPKATGRMDEYRGISVGNIIECEGGYIEVAAGNYTSARAFDAKGKLLQEWTGSASHYANFIDAVKSRKASDLNAPIVEGHVSSALSHLANVSQLLGHSAHAAEVSKALSGDAPLGEAFTRMKQHLSANGIDIEKAAIQLGAALTLDPKTERFTGDHAAAARRLSRHEYRQPFAVPEVT
jgi:predicted dehydrogenase